MKTNSFNSKRAWLLVAQLLLGQTVFAQYEVVPKDKYKVTDAPSVLVHGGGSILEINGKKFKDPVSDGVIYIKEKKCFVFGEKVSSGNYNLVFLFDNGNLVKLPVKSSTIVLGIGRKEKENGASYVTSVRGGIIQIRVSFTEDIVGDGEIPPTENYEVDLDKRTIAKMK